MSDSVPTPRYKKRHSDPVVTKPNRKTIPAVAVASIAQKINTRRLKYNASIQANSTAFMESIRTAIDDVDQSKPAKVDPTDEFGASLTKLLNHNPEFSLQTSSYLEDEDYVTPTLKPLLSQRNWKWILQQWSYAQQSETWVDAGRQVISMLIANAKPISTGLWAFFFCTLVQLIAVSATTAVVTLWSLHATALLLLLFLSVLVDWKEVSQALPRPVTVAIDKVVPTMIWIDGVVLIGGRFRGREWNEKGFEWHDNGKGASSFSRYLWGFPPPVTADNSPNHWSSDTEKHVHAIDFCHTMLHEAHVKRQYAKLRKTVNKWKKAAKKGGTRTGPAKLFTDESQETVALNSKLQQETDAILRNLQETERRKAVTFSDTLSFKELKSTVDKGGTTDMSALNTILSEEDCLQSDISTEVNSSLDIAPETELNWIDVGAQIGKKILGSAAVQKAMTSHDTAERLAKNAKKQFGHADNNTNSPRLAEGNRDQPLSKKKEVLTALPPVHTMWTDASAAANSVGVSPTSTAIGLSQADATPVNRGSPQTPKQSSSETHLGSSARNDLAATPKRSSSLPEKSTRSGDVECSYPVALTAGSHDVPATPGATDRPHRKRALLMRGVKIAVPIIPYQPGCKISKTSRSRHFQMGTVISSKRLAIFQKNKLPPQGKRGSNCLSVTVQLDKSFLRNGQFAEMTFRVMDEWSDRYMPKHSKLPLGSCVATAFGLGVLVGWRVEDDCHIVRSLWQRRGIGSAHAYLQRDAIYSTVEASVGFEVETLVGNGEVVAYVEGGKNYKSGRFVVDVTDGGRNHGKVLTINRKDVLTCKSARFIPVVEHLKAAVQYQLELDSYNAAMKVDTKSKQFELPSTEIWNSLSKYSDILWKSFLRATEEDEEFDEGMNEFITSVVDFFDRLDDPQGYLDSKGNDVSNIVITATESTHSSKHTREQGEASWFMKDMFGLFGSKTEENNGMPAESIEMECSSDVIDPKTIKSTYDRAFAILRTLMRIVSIARASCGVDEPNFRIAMSVCYEILIFVKTIIKVQQKNISPSSLKIWKRAWDEIVSTFGPVKDRLEKIGKGIAERMEKQGRRAKIRVLRFVDTVVQDEVLLLSLEQGDWKKCGERLEEALVTAKIVDEESREHYHKTAQFIYNHFAHANSRNGTVAARNNAKLARLGTTIQFVAAPRRSILRVLIDDKVMDALERVLVRVFDSEKVASQMLSIHASNFHTLRHFRLLKDFTIAGKFWMPLLEAADTEFSWLVAKMPSSVQEYLVPLSNLFSLGIAQFRMISDGDVTTDWLDFMLQDEAVRIIHDIDMKLILALESFSRDVKDMMVVLPYYPSIEDDILNLVDEVDIDQFLKEASEAVDDPGKTSEFIREKATVAIERFLDYLPKMSIPVEKRDLAEGWMLTCRGADGGDLTLTDLSIKRENLTCQVMGGDTLFFPMLGNHEDECKSDISEPASAYNPPVQETVGETSVLDHIRDLILNAQLHGCWQEGVGGVSQPPTDRYVASVLKGLPVSAVLNCGIELWRNLEIDDDELLEIAIRDVTYQIQLHEDGIDADLVSQSNGRATPVSIKPTEYPRSIEASDVCVHRFNPRVDPSVLYLEIQKLTFHLDQFLFRIEKNEQRRTVFDPVFEGSGSLLVRNVSIKLRVECVKQYIDQPMGRRVAVPLLQIGELDVKLEKVKLKVKDTGADWILNGVVKSFEDNITQIVASNLSDQVRVQLDLALENLNGYFAVNPDLMLGFLDITIDDLEEKVVWV
eukprot:Nitzschia sp. Nitz4//scaffold43_size134323//59252//64701//NITZ4_003299-RA/size134323-processed-gene-0.11-mRNA-1//1//CDS//3329551948//8322//frame0